MCGIAGFINIENIESEKIHSSMHHRGPDSKGSFVYNNISIFHNRLAIQDLSENGSQPFIYNDYVIVLNGEIYNHLELREKISSFKFISNSDTETLLYLFIKYGADCLKELDGMFAFVILHKPSKKIFFARDRAGKKPLYYYKKDNKFFFASELETISKNIPLEINDNHINSFLRSGFFYKDQTPYNNLYEFPAGNYGWLDSKTIDFQIETWWSISKFYNSSKLTLNKNEIIDQLDNYLHLGIKRRLVSSDLEVGTFLSGGIDSGLITAIASKYKNNIKTFTVSFDGQYDESHLAKLVANKYSLNHTCININYNNLLNNIEEILINYGEPFADSSAIPSFYVSQEAKKHVTVILNGDGGDELFGGYRRYIPFSKANFFNFNPFFKFLFKRISKKLNYPKDKLSLYNYFYRLIDLSGKDSLLEVYLSSTSDIFEGHLDCFNNKDRGLEKINNAIGLKSKSILNGLDLMMEMDFNSFMQGDLLVKMDIATMSSSLEGRSPFLSKELLEFAPQIPNKYKINKTTTKYILRELSKQYLPKELITQPKRGFEIPLKNWVNNQLSEKINDYITSEGISSNFINKNFINKLLNNKISISSEKRAKILWSLFTLEVWYKNYKQKSF